MKRTRGMAPGGLPNGALTTVDVEPADWSRIATLDR